MDVYVMAKEAILGVAMAVLAGLMVLSLIKAIAGPRFTDRILAINMISTQGLLMICVLTLLLDQQYLADVALIYALLGFLAVVAMSGILLGMHNKKHGQETKEEVEE